MREKLKPEETRKFVENAFRDGVLKIAGTDVDRLMPPVSHFGGGSGSRDKKKRTVTAFYFEQDRSLRKKLQHYERYKAQSQSTGNN